MLLAAQDVEGEGGGMTDLQVRDEAMTIFLAGHETTANAMAWCWYLLALNPDAERRLYAEVDHVLGSRLPNLDGKGVKGQHPVVIELDEGQDYPEPGYDEILECLKEVEGAQFRIHGVPKGLRDRFWKWSTGQDPDLPFTVHRKLAMERPTWNDFERRRKIALYTSRMNPNYRRNIYGEHGDAHTALFVLARLLACTDLETGSAYNTEVYQLISITDEDIRAERGSEDPADTDWIDTLVESRLSRGHLVGFTNYHGGADIGVTNHPSEFLIFGQRQGTDVLELLTRVNLQRINTDDQKFVIEQLFSFYGSKLKDW